MKVKLLPLICLFASSTLLSALPKVAVLDALLPAKMDKDISIGITEKISEELVSSLKFTVLDRTTIAQSLKELEFQMSGIVSNAEIKKAGERLGADYVVVTRVSLVAGTYFISAKMIDVQTGAITAQASDEDEGKASITLKIASRVGIKLSEGNAGTAVTAGKTDNEVQLSMLMYMNNPSDTASSLSWDSLLAGFKSANPNTTLTIEYEYKESSYLQKLSAAAAAGQLPDLIYNWPNTLIAGGKLKDLRPFLKGHEGEFIPAALIPQGPNGELFELPRGCDRNSYHVHQQQAAKGIGAHISENTVGIDRPRREDQGEKIDTDRNG